MSEYIQASLSTLYAQAVFMRGPKQKRPAPDRVKRGQNTGFLRAKPLGGVQGQSPCFVCYHTTP